MRSRSVNRSLGASCRSSVAICASLTPTVLAIATWVDPDALPIEALSHLQNDEFSHFRIESRFREQRKEQSEGGTTCGGRVRQQGESVGLRRMFGKTA